MNDEQRDLCRRVTARVAIGQLDQLSTSDRILVCEGIASLFPEESKEASKAKEHAEALRTIERQQLLLSEILTADH